MRGWSHELEGGFNIWSILLGDDFVGRRDRVDGQEDLIIGVLTLSLREILHLITSIFFFHFH